MSHFQDATIPNGARLVGYAALVQQLGIAAPVRRPCAVSESHVRGSTRHDNSWVIFDKRYWPGDQLLNHLAFAFKHEPFDALVMKMTLEALPQAEVEAAIRRSPSAPSMRRLWCLYEILTRTTLALPDAPQMAAVDLLDPKEYFTGVPHLSKRHRVRVNLLGTAGFCPVIRRTTSLQNFLSQDLSARARDTVGRTSAHLITRAASFMLLADSRASFEIEGERPPRTRLERWARAVMQTGKAPLTLDELLRLHGILIADTRFVREGLRPDGVFLGERDHTGDPVPEFIGARPQQLTSLVSDMLEANDRMREGGLDAVLQAAATAFAFVYVHPFEDGNGRLHRCLIHHVLAERSFTPTGMVFPVSSVMLDRIEEYRTILQRHSGPLMPFIDWRPTAERNVEVINDTDDMYRYFDCTEAAEFLYACVQRTVDEDLPREIDYLRRHDEAVRRIMEAVEMPDRTAELLILYIRQNAGALPKTRREGPFRELTDDEVSTTERIVSDAFALE